MRKIISARRVQAKPCTPDLAASSRKNAAPKDAAFVSVDVTFTSGMM